MAGETPITLVGNLTADPELRFTPSGAAVASFTVASTPRQFDRQTNEWRDGEAMFLNCSVWRQAAENVAESLTKGMRVVVSGRLKARSYETRESSSCARSRAQRSASASESRFSCTGASCASRTRRIVSTIPRKGMRPAWKASTASSLAAL